MVPPLNDTSLLETPLEVNVTWKERDETRRAPGTFMYKNDPELKKIEGLEEIAIA